MARLLGASIVFSPTRTKKSAVYMDELKRGAKLGEEFEQVCVFDVMSQDDIGADSLYNFTNSAEAFACVASRHQLRAVNRIGGVLIGFNAVGDHNVMT